ncbi:RagB/SusD family nutrient uptake outer membrane protein [Flavobacterium sp.]|uniref:RagB/SusD family nutrient uptake outer membrane protein n=1 Tax=Flavobacterium sp. TaxID=239 RepID=UPI0022C841CA|nr:RagB/SusD family nutrient uptake outer membrane protein [Flavobacterium sp.]MCZ8169410.1 RagB/SusD family nutrient uptake outer membrane protein [Flavobacterium sp.]
MKVFKILLVLSVFAGFTGCEDATDIVQKGELNDQALFRNVENMQLYLNETYDRFSVESDIVVSSVLTDEVALGSGLTVNDTHRFFVVSTNGYARSIWANHYSLINYCNRLIRGAALFTPPAGDLPAYNSILAQARALRAFAHFQLMVYFSPDLSNNNALGVVLADRVPAIEDDLPRVSNGTLYTFIENDIAFAEANLIEVLPISVSHKFVNFNFLNAFKARMYLYRKDYVKALQFANLVISNSGVTLAQSTFTLPANYPATTDVIPPTGTGTGSTTINVQPSNTPAQAVQRALFQIDQWNSTAAPAYRRMWVDADKGESLMSIDRPNNRSNFSSQYNTNGSYWTGGPLFDMGRNLFNLYTQPMGGGAQDFRRWCFVDRSATISTDPNSATRTDEVIVIDKYPGKAGSHTSNDIKLFRLSEMYFIRAECLVRNGDLAGAAAAIQLVRQARNYIVGAVVPTPTYASAQAAFADILLERRKELAFEGHRYIDLKRLGADAGVTSTDRFSQDSNNSSATSPANIDITDYRFTLPIPQDERNVNNIPQNNGY